MTNEKPLISVGMPVYNGAKYLRQSLNSLLAQDYEHFEFIISDNASTDGTSQICGEYAAKDPRIQYFRNEKNMGAAWNFEHVFRLSQGDYFMWAAHDDLWAPNYVSECLRKLQQEPNAVLCCSTLKFIDANDNPIPKEHPNLDTSRKELPRRVRDLLLQPGWFAIYGLIRSTTLRKVRIGRSEWGADVLLQLELLMLGEFVCTSATIFYYRLLGKSAKDYDVSISPARATEPLRKPYMGLVRNLLRTVVDSNQNLFTKVILCIEILYFGLIDGGDLPHHIREEYVSTYFASYQQGDSIAVIKSAPIAFLLNPKLWMNRGAWAILVRSLVPALSRKVA